MNDYQRIAAEAITRKFGDTFALNPTEQSYHTGAEATQEQYGVCVVTYYLEEIRLWAAHVWTMHNSAAMGANLVACTTVEAALDEAWGRFLMNYTLYHQAHGHCLNKLRELVPSAE